MKYIRSLSSRPVLVIFLAAVGVTVMIGWRAYEGMRIYRMVQPIWVEQAAYGQAPMLAFRASIEKNGFWNAASQLGDERHLLELLALGIFFPASLGWFHAPLLAVLPALLIFLALFGWTIYKRTGHLGYSIAAMLFFCTIAQLTRHNWGIGSGFADWQSMLFLSAAALSLINASKEPGLGWIRAFAVLVSLAVLARTTSMFYAAVICGPMVLLVLVAQYRRERSFIRLAVTLLNIIVIIAPVAAVVIGQLARMFLYYGSVNAWNLHQPFLVSANNIFSRLLAPFLGFPFIVVCVSLFLFNILKHTPEYAAQRRSIGAVMGFSEIAIGWWIAGFLGFLLANGYTSDVPKEVMYVTPALMLAAITPLRNFAGSALPHNKKLSAGLAALSLACFGYFSYQNAVFAREITPEQAAFKKIQSDMARELAKLPSGITWQSYASIDWGIPVSLVTQYEFGEYRQYGGTPFYNKKAYWDTWYPNRSMSEIQNELYAQAADCVDAAVILKEPERQPDGMEDYSYAIAAHIARSVKADPNWSLVVSLDGWPAGVRYQIYSNDAPASSRNCQP